MPVGSSARSCSKVPSNASPVASILHTRDSLVQGEKHTPVSVVAVAGDRDWALNLLRIQALELEEGRGSGSMLRPVYT